jgi:hypothetical protein
MDAYRIGVSIVLANGVSPILAIIGKDLLGLKTSINAIEQNFGGWTTALVGFGSVLAGSAILGTVTKLAEKAADFQDALTKVSQLNPKVAALVNSGEVKKMAFGLGTQLGMNVEDITKIYGGIYGVLQDPKEAEELTPYAARYARLMQMRHPGSHPEESINTLMRAGELSGRLTDERGGIDQTKVKEWFDLAARLEAATHGQVNPETLLGLAQQGGGVSLRGLSQEGYEHMAIVAQMMGGQRAGTSLLSLRSQMTGNMMKRSAEAMQDYGLLKDGEWSSEGGHVQMTDEAAHRMLSLVNKDPMTFVNTLVDRLEAKGITNKDDQMLALQRILGRQTTQRMVSDMLLARQQIARETTGLDQGATVDQGLSGYDRNIHAAQENLGAAWHNLQVAMGDQETQKFADIINRIARGLNSVTDSITRLTPQQMDKVFEVITGVGAGLIVLGGILTGALLTSIVGAPILIGAAATALAAALATLAAFNPDWLQSDSISQWLNRSLIDPIQSFLHSDSIARAFAGLGDAILAAIKSALSNAYHGITGVPVQPDAQKFNDQLKDANKNYVPMRFDSGVERPKAQPVSFSLSVDGRTLAEAVSEQLSELMAFPTGAGAPDHYGQWADADSNLSTT